jgi:hypothetical protein
LLRWQLSAAFKIGVQTFDHLAFTLLYTMPERLTQQKHFELSEPIVRRTRPAWLISVCSTFGGLVFLTKHTGVSRAPGKCFAETVIEKTERKPN